jgi:transposase
MRIFVLNLKSPIMIHTEDLKCPYCDSNNLVKNGHRANGTQRWRCNACKKSFQFKYTYNAHKAGVKAEIVTHTLNASGVRDTARVLKIAKGTVISELKKKRLSIKIRIS